MTTTNPTTTTTPIVGPCRACGTLVTTPDCARWYDAGTTTLHVCRWPGSEAK